MEYFHYKHSIIITTLVVGLKYAFRAVKLELTLPLSSGVNLRSKNICRQSFPISDLGVASLIASGAC